MAVDELNRLAQKQVPDAIARIRADLNNDEYTNAGIEAVHRLRLRQADYIRLAAELDAATRSFRLMEQGLRRQIDAALADWELRFAAVPPSAAAPGRQSGLRGLLRLGRTRTPPTTRQDARPRRQNAPPDLPDPAPGPVLADEFPPPAPEDRGADITALVLGPLELTVGGERVPRWTSLKARAIFQYLLIHRGRPVRRDVLMELEWPDHSYKSARNNLNVALCNLRNTLDLRGPGTEAILHKEGCYLLNPELSCWTDRGEFLSNLREAKRAREADNPHRVITACRSAVQLYRGPLFEDGPGAEWYLPERRQLMELYLQALQCVAEACCDRGQLPTAIELGQRAISTDPCYEPGHRLLMRCYARQQQQQLVSRQYRQCAHALRDELDVSPAAETVQLFHVLTSASQA